MSRKRLLGKENTHEKVNYHHHRTNYDAIHRTKLGRRSTARDRRKTPKTAITIKVEQVPDEDEKTAETAFVGEVSGDKSVTEAPKEEASVFQETVTEECTEGSETIIIEMEEDTVECLDEGDQSLAEYKPQVCGQLNPFENDIPIEIDDRPIEDYICEGEYRPGEEKRF